MFLTAGYGSFRAPDAIDQEHVDRHYDIDPRVPLLQSQALAGAIRDGGKSLPVGSGTVGGMGEDARTRYKDNVADMVPLGRIGQPKDGAEGWGRRMGPESPPS